MNKYPLWKNILLVVIFIIAIFYALPNIFGTNPAIQISSATPGLALIPDNLQSVENTLKTNHITYKSANIENKSIYIRFTNTDTQLEAKSVLKNSLGDQYIVALNLESATPNWLMAIGAQPMKLGLDLQGGVHFLLQIDMDSVIQRREKGDVRNIGVELRDKRIRYTGIAPLHDGGIGVRFSTAEDLQNARDLLQNRFAEFLWKPVIQGDSYQLEGKLVPASLQTIKQYAVDQAMTTLRRRVNELGVSEAVVQQEGQDRISVDLPGIQDATQAKDILGKTATLEFHLVDTNNDASAAVGGLTPPGDELFMYEGSPILLKNRIVLSGESITNASAGFDETSRPSVNIRLGGGGEALFTKITGENVGKPLAVVYVETKSQQQTLPNGQTKIIYKKERRIINVANIESALPSSFQITGLSSPEESKSLALLLRAGTLIAPLTIIQEQTVGPSMGQENIRLGKISLAVGLLFIIVFMLFYYHMFGLTADIGLLVNLVFLVAILSVIGATLTFPGIAGIVLTLGMAVDYNVLIYERIREEVRNGVTPQPAIHTGYDKAFVTIIDANITTLIVALILFALGSGAVKGFAITLTIGLFTSIISSVTYTRALVNWIYGGRRVKHLAIGIKTPASSQTRAVASDLGAKK